MLLKLYPKVHRRYTALPILGPILDGFWTWLLKQGYATDCAREHFCTARRLTRILEQRGIHSLAKLTRARLRACAPANRLDDHRLTATVHFSPCLFRLRDVTVPVPAADAGRGPSGVVRDVFGAGSRAGALLDRGLLRYNRRLVSAHRLREASLASRHPEYRRYRSLHLPRRQETGATLSPASGRPPARLPAVCGVPRGDAPMGLNRQIDTPRVYREEQLARALPWETVRAFLRAIDRTTPCGRRDYAIFLLIATYGCEPARS